MGVYAFNEGGLYEEAYSNYIAEDKNGDSVEVSQLVEVSKEFKKIVDDAVSKMMKENASEYDIDDVRCYLNKFIYGIAKDRNFDIDALALTL